MSTFLTWQVRGGPARYINDRWAAPGLPPRVPNCFAALVLDPKEGPRDPKEGPRDPKEGPRDPKDGPRDPKEGPRDPKEGPRDPKEGPRRMGLAHVGLPRMLLFASAPIAQGEEIIIDYVRFRVVRGVDGMEAGIEHRVRRGCG